MSGPLFESEATVNSRPVHLFLSPHPGDALLACGATMAHLARKGARVLVAVPFVAFRGDGRDVERETHDAWAHVGARGWIGLYPPAERRRHPAEGRLLYTHPRTLYGLPDPSEGDLPHRLAGEITALVDEAPAFIYAPLAMTRHVDHIHLASAGHVLARAGYRVLWYEEFPRRPVRETIRTLKRRGWSPLLLPLSEGDARAKVAALHALRFRIPRTFGHAREIERRVEDDLWTQSGQGYRAERFWERTQGGRP